MSEPSSVFWSSLSRPQPQAGMILVSSGPPGILGRQHFKVELETAKKSQFPMKFEKGKLHVY